MSSMTVGTDKLALSVSADFGGQPAVHSVIGLGPVLLLHPALIEFSARCGQPGAMQDIAYFLSKPGAMPRTPHLLLVSRTATLDLADPGLNGLLGLLLIFEHRIGGFGAGAFATNDRSGRSTVVAMPSDRPRVVEHASRALLSRGARLILMSYRSEEGGAAPDRPLFRAPAPGKEIAHWTTRDRTIPGYLPLGATYAATLAKIGQRTRSNLRYYRRRAEADLGCTFLPSIQPSREEVLAFNRECSYAGPEAAVAWRFDSLNSLASPLFAGIKDREGRWLSMLGGRRYADRSELLWQMNREGLPAYSLGAVMRSYFIEHEIAQGSSRLYIEGGTSHPIRFSFMPENLTDLVIVRDSPIAKLMQRAARRAISPDNELLELLGAKNAEWHPC